MTLGQASLQWAASPQRIKRNSSEAARPVLWTFVSCSTSWFEGRGWIYGVCRHRNGRMRRSSLVPSRNKKVSKCTAQPLAGSARGMQHLDAAACGQPLGLSTEAVPEPFLTFVLVNSAQRTYRMLQRRLRAATFPWNRGNSVQQCPSIQVGDNSCPFKGKPFPI